MKRLSPEKEAGILLTVIAHLAALIVLLATGLGHALSREQSLVLDFTNYEQMQAEIERLERQAAIAERINRRLEGEIAAAGGGGAESEVRNVAVDRAALRDDRGTDAEQLYRDAERLQQELAEGYELPQDDNTAIAAPETRQEQNPWKDEAARYYFNICGKYGAQVGKLLDKLESLEVELICPLHGPMLTDVAQAVRLYRLWSSYEPENDSVLVAYASIHGGTARLALRLAEMLEKRGASVVLRDLSRCDVSYAVSDAFRCRRTVLAASSYDAGVFPPMHDFLWHLQIKSWQNRQVAVVQNGSWSPTAGRAICDMLAAMKNVEQKGETLTIRSRMHAADLPALEALADAVLS